MMQNFPALVRDLTENVFPNSAERSTGLVRSKQRGRLQRYNADSQSDWPPGPDPVLYGSSIARWFARYGGPVRRREMKLLVICALCL